MGLSTKTARCHWTARTLAEILGVGCCGEIEGTELETGRGIGYSRNRHQLRMREITTEVRCASRMVSEMKTKKITFFWLRRDPIMKDCCHG